MPVGGPERGGGQTWAAMLQARLWHDTGTIRGQTDATAFSPTHAVTQRTQKHSAECNEWYKNSQQLGCANLRRWQTTHPTFGCSKTCNMGRFWSRKKNYNTGTSSLVTHGSTIPA